MAKNGSPFQKGGGGTNFEQSIQTAFLISLIIRGNAPSLEVANEITEVSLQTSNLGYQTDDLLIKAKSHLGIHKLVMQIKHDISFTINDTMFNDVLSSFWKDFNNTALFDKTKDKLIIVKGGLTQKERNHFKSLFNWANSHATYTDFLKEVNPIAVKKEALDTFRFILKEINQGTPIADSELWEFLKCLDVLEYDLLQSASIDKTYFLNLIKLSKNEECKLNELEIWNNALALVTILNKDGGNLTDESIKEKELYRYFSPKNVFPYFKEIQRLKTDSTIILSAFSNSIESFHLKRSNISNELYESLNKNQITIVTGKPGVGKSAKMKDFLLSELPKSSFFAFRADQFNQPHLANVLSKHGLNIALQDFFSCISLVPEKVIYLDSLEKLLEADHECAFKQLIESLKTFPDIKLIGSSRKYAIDLLTQKFGLSNVGIVEIPQMSDEELEVVTEIFPNTRTALLNEKLRPLLRSPKYLELLIKAIQKDDKDYSLFNQTAFVKHLWNILVVDERNDKNGLPIKRENAFIEIALKRAKEMKLFTKPKSVDEEAISLLVKDDILIQEPSKRNYAPAHDILEDWALIEHIEQIYNDSLSSESFFQQLGKEPAIRRAFRIWIEKLLLENRTEVGNLIKDTLGNTVIEDYWIDEILVSVFRSDNNNSFFVIFEDELLKNDASLLVRCLHIIRTCCKENSLHLNILLPIGSGWSEIFIFIAKHIESLQQVRPNILSFLMDWHYKLLFLYNTIDDNELNASKRIVIYYLFEIEIGIDFWKKRANERKKSEIISILLNLATIADDEIRRLVSRIYSIGNDNYYRADSFYDMVLEKIVAGIHNSRLIRILPDLVIECAWKEWKSNKKEEDADWHFFSGLRDTEAWGVEDRVEFNPPGIYKTPLLNLLRMYPFKGLEFFVQFVNYSVNTYVESEVRSKKSIEELEIEFDGIKKIWASQFLWNAYRGTHHTNNLIESLLMSFEQYLFEIAEQKTEISRKNIKFVFDYVFKNTSNVAPLGVLTSVSIAYPTEVKDSFLPLLGVKEFYEWDQTRAISEMSIIAEEDYRISFAQAERLKSNQLPHRGKYTRGLVDFIQDYQFNIREHNHEIHLIFDKLKDNAKDNDIFWKKRLTEIDVRNHTIGEYDKDLKGFPVLPDYKDEVYDFIESEKEGLELHRKEVEYFGLLNKAYEKEKAITFETWNSIYNFYLNHPEIEYIYFYPCTLAYLGFRDFIEDLNDDQKNYCFSTLCNYSQIILQETFNRNFGERMKYSVLEKLIPFKSFHFLLSHRSQEDDYQKVMTLLIYTIIAPFHKHEIEEIIKYIREEFFVAYPTEGKKLWLVLLKYSKYRHDNPYYYDEPNSERLKRTKDAEFQFITEQIISNDDKFDLSEISFESHEAYLLARGIRIIPIITDDILFKDYIVSFVSLLPEDLEKEESFSHASNGERQIYMDDLFTIEDYLSEYFILGDLSLSKTFLEKLVESTSIYLKKGEILGGNYDLYNFIQDTLIKTIVFIDLLVGNHPDEETKVTTTVQFWELWTYLSELIIKFQTHYLEKQLLLDIDWKDQAKDWMPLRERRDNYNRLVDIHGSSNAKSILNVLSTIGEVSLLPEGITKLVEILKNDNNQTDALMAPSATRLIKRLFHNHISSIKNKASLVNDFVWILNTMINLGSSEAYLFRENVIMYKQKNMNYS